MYNVKHLAKEAKEIPLKDIEPNGYNPNTMPFKEMTMLAVCILRYGFLFPVLVYWNGRLQKYVIIDGYHRWKTLCDLADSKSRIYKAACRTLKVKTIKTNTSASCVVLDIDEKEAIQLTILMNRIKGAHSVAGMENVVGLLSGEHQMDDVEVAVNLGMEGEEYIRLNHQGKRLVAEKFKNHEYPKSWKIK